MKTADPTTTEARELLPCPFCGWQPERVLCDDAYSHKVNYFVRCDPCDLVLEFHGSPKEAVTQWNRRAPDEARSLALETLKDCQKWFASNNPIYGKREMLDRIDAAIRATEQGTGDV